MNSNSYLIGIDVGTSGCKSILIDSLGSISGISFSEYPSYSPNLLWSEQNPEDWWKATI
ncbi:MAG: FGGY family carbohydrate kinase, partial [Ignavibacteria bacterium]|nr:FGGY family carbohydrate kinase [Ignavibacteria bacterium]